MRVTLITSNVGSLFESDHRLHDPWIETIVKKVQSTSADFVVINTQETGGKDPEHGVEKVEPLFRNLLGRLSEYSIQKIYTDLDWQQNDRFTALGQIVLSKGHLEVSQFNFDEKKFCPAKNDLEVVTSCLNKHPEVVNKKFPKSFRSGRWGRKGYLHTKWKVNGRLFDFVNVHLFHDESNIALVHENPTLYSDFRKRALNFVMEEVKEGENGYVPHVFLFGDFNFRLHLPSLLERITLKSVRHNFEEEASLSHHGSVSNGLEVGTLQPDPIRRSVSAIEFRDESKTHEVDNGLDKQYTSNNGGTDCRCILRIEKKKFEYFNHKELLNSWRDYRCDDREAKAFENLSEFPIDFPPTYPWSEDPDEHENLMNTRAPAWCDRVLMNQSAFSVATSGLSTYTSIGLDVCLGDHKPVSLSFSC